MDYETTDWHPGDPPLADRPGEYETQVGDLIARRWWDGSQWSIPYFPDDPAEIIAESRNAKLEDAAVIWRGMSHRFVVGQKVRHGNLVCSIVGRRASTDGKSWSYELTSARWYKSSWGREDQVRPAVMPGDAL